MPMQLQAAPMAASGATNTEEKGMSTKRNTYLPPSREIRRQAYEAAEHGRQQRQRLAKRGKR